ncbi:MAG: hypothetical protein IT422_28120 [Pirellulaceae bacterium]|nr:hypothetical protein [Pirellulaceae bacterium]
MNEDGQLDLTSEALTSAAAGTPRQAQAAKPPRLPEQSMRVFFHCCRVYATVHVPLGVTNGRLSSWRFHCPRCGKLNEIPLDE